MQWSGIPTCIGIGPTKTLAKLANHIAKTAERKPGVNPERFPGHGPDGSIAQICHQGILGENNKQTLFERSAVTEVWGVGPQIGRQLKDIGIATVQDLVQLDPVMVARRWSVVLERTVRELQGTPCIDLENEPSPKQQIACTRSFGHPVTEQAELAQAITEFASRAAEKLRRQKQQASQILTFVRTSPFRRQDDQYSRSMVLPLVRPTPDTGVLVNAALATLKAIYRPCFKYAKAGVMLLDLMPEGFVQGELDWGERSSVTGQVTKDRSRVMGVIDNLNIRYGRGTLKLASGGTEHGHLVQPGVTQSAWRMKQERRTPRYTTHWQELAVVKG